MKKFELGKVYQQMNRDGSICAEYTPLFVTEKNAFGQWTRYKTSKDEQECAIPHRYLNEFFDNSSEITWYREKPPEPESIELFVNIYKDKNGKLVNGGVLPNAETARRVASVSVIGVHVGIAHIKFTEGDG